MLACDARSTAYSGVSRWADVIGAAEQAAERYETYGVTDMLGYVRNVRGIALLGPNPI